MVESFQLLNFAEVNEVIISDEQFYALADYISAFEYLLACTAAMPGEDLKLDDNSERALRIIIARNQVSDLCVRDAKFLATFSNRAKRIMESREDKRAAR